MSMSPTARAAVARQKSFLGHPVGLYILFFTEMWERFSYYGMRALLVLYMTNYFLWTQEDASTVAKWYTSLVYLTPILGGFLADRYLGNKWAIIIGAVSMSIGHFCMAFEHIHIFYAALLFLIIGNGFFKPNMSTQVGRLYPAGDPRRDGAYTIFYMGINLGAFLSPIICGALARTAGLGYHWGFAAAGVGMVIGLLTYLLGLPLIQELPPDLQYEPTEEEKRAQAAHHHGHQAEPVLTEEQAAVAPSASPGLTAISPMLLGFGAIALLVVFAALAALGAVAPDNAIGLGVGGAISAGISAWILSKQQAGLRDRVLAILILGLFVIFFWGAFEQASNAMNVFADKTTNRYVTAQAPPPDIYPPAAAPEKEDGSAWAKIVHAFANIFQFNPMATATFQSINPLAIFVLAPLFAWLWTALPRHGINLSIPAKMAIGVFLQGAAFSLMVYSVQFENKPSSVAIDRLPDGVWANSKENNRVVFRDAPDLDADDAKFAAFDKPDPAHGEVVVGGRLRLADGRLQMTGVLSDTDRDRILRASVSSDYLRQIRDFARAAAAPKEGDAVSVVRRLENLPAGFDFSFAGVDPEKVTYDAATQTLTAKAELHDREYKLLLQAGTDAKLRDALNQLFITSAAFKVSVWWLVAFYIICTLGELCLSPVGLSMVSKLAPAKYSTMLMGMWLLTSFFGNYLAGLAGESYGTVNPAMYFGVIAGVLFAASLVCFLCVRKVVSMMHGVR